MARYKISIIGPSISIGLSLEGQSGLTVVQALLDGVRSQVEIASVVVARVSKAVDQLFEERAMTKDERIGRALCALDRDYLKEGDERTAIVDLLADLRHLCKDRAIDFDAANSMAEIHFKAEQQPVSA